MKTFVKTAVIGLSLLLSASLGFAADAKAPAKADIKAPAAAVKPAETKAALKAPVDINAATDVELKAIPGIGDAYAAKIIAGRPYANKTQLKSRNILPAVVYEQVKDKIIAKQAKK
jgi:DNA uptake protein ComE-like DNA-binding protein